jgi:quercetin dioxygenase-like cupin family protein
MGAFEQNRRSFLANLGGLGMSSILPQGSTEGQSPSHPGYVLSATEGEHLIHFRDKGNIIIKASATTGSADVAMGTQQVMKGTGIPTHRHFHMDEAFFVLEGSGTFILNEARHAFEKSGTIFIPKNSWHGFENPDNELLFLWIVTPPGLDNFFRETCDSPGAPPKALTRDQIKQIALKYGTEFK